MIVPNKASIYGNAYLPGALNNGNTYTTADRVVAYLSEHTDLNVVYPKEDLLGAVEQDSNRNYYYKTDSHWNELGAYIGSKSLLRHMGICLPDLESFEIITTAQISGDLAAMLGLSDFLKYDDAYFLQDYFIGQTAELIYPIEGETELHCSSTSNKDERALFMVRDSFAAAMMPYLHMQFNDCCFVHFDLFTPDMLQQYPSDVVVLEVVERYMWRLVDFKVA